MEHGDYKENPPPAATDISKFETLNQFYGIGPSIDGKTSNTAGYIKNVISDALEATYIDFLSSLPFNVGGASFKPHDMFLLKLKFRGIFDSNNAFLIRNERGKNVEQRGFS